MLNISNYSISKRVYKYKFKSLTRFDQLKQRRVILKLFGFTFLLLFVILMLPWTQNIRSRGAISTLRPDQRPQTIHSVIGGRIERWHVKEGDFVNKGDTILEISETKSEYFDPNLLSRTEEQMKSKQMSVKAYMEKVNAIDNQISAMLQTGELKLQQTDNMLKQAMLKVQSDSIDWKAAKVNYSIAQEQYQRMQNLYSQGLKSLTDLENRELTMQKAEADMISKENKLLTSINEVINAEVELISIQAQYRDDVAKAESEKYSALSNMYEAEAVVTKIQNEYMNYSVRLGMYFITAPQAGYLTQAIQSGIGETIKEGTPIISIMPSDYDLVVELFVRPIDLPLVAKDQEVRIQFDGWPAIVFSGWPNKSYGTYGGKVFAIDNFISTNGMYRVLVLPDETDNPWPNALRVGSGTQNMLMLKVVPVWYELWRQINGFPPDFYQPVNTNQSKK